MLMSQLFGRTLREDPAGATSDSHRLLVRSAMISQLGTGIYSYLPGAFRALARIEAIIADEMDGIGGQRIEMPVVHPADVWKQSRRWFDVGDEMVRFQDRMGHDMVLAMTHEEIVADLAVNHVSSYRDLPLLIYQIQTKFRDEPRSRAGLIRVREFVMKDAYSLHGELSDMAEIYDQVVGAYVRIFRRCGLEAVVVQSDTGMMGGSVAHEFMLLDPSGEDTVVICSACGLAANQEIAQAETGQPPVDRPLLPLTEVATPGATTIEQVAEQLGIEQSETAKAVFFSTDDELVFAVIRGDKDVSPAKLAKFLKRPVVPAVKSDLDSAGIVAGYASPVGLSGVTVVVDNSVAHMPNLVGGANRPGFHLRNTNFPRDYEGQIGDISQVTAGDACPECGGSLITARGIELGNTFQLGYGYSEKRGALFVDRAGKRQPFFMCSYGIGVGRILGAVAERWNDADGMILPATISPWGVHIVQLGTAPAVVAAAIEIETALRDLQLTVLRDDRNESAGVKFNDADLLGLPVRVTVSARNLREGQLEIRVRDGGQTSLVPLPEAAATVLRIHDELESRNDPARPRWDPVSELGAA